MSQPVANVGHFKNRTTSGAISAGPCQLLGFYVNSTSSGVITIEDGSTSISGNITPAIGFHHFPAVIGTSASLTVVSGTIDLTFFHAAGH